MHPNNKARLLLFTFTMQMFLLLPVGGWEGIKEQGGITSMESDTKWFSEVECLLLLCLRLSSGQV